MTHATPSTPTLYMVRADYTRFAPAFRKGGYVGVGWIGNHDLSTVSHRDEIRAFYETQRPDAATMNVAQNVGQIWRFLHDLTVGTYVMTPLKGNSELLVGQITSDYYYTPNPEPGDSRYPHRKAVNWFSEPITRSMLSVPAQNTLRSSLTIFQISQAEEILRHYNVALPERSERILMTDQQIKEAILGQILELDAYEFEFLIKEVLSAIGFIAEQTKPSGDEGIDVIGKLTRYEFASIDVVVQVKRYKSGQVDHNTIKKFRGDVPERVQAAFVTTSDYTYKARAEAQKEGFIKIGLINGLQLVDIIVEHYEELPEDLQQKLKLRKTYLPQA